MFRPPPPLKSATRANKSGFTLIEMSIVLVVIGLVIGGILFGQDMIRASEMRAQIGDIERLNTAINTFKLKYNCLPGDCAEATQLFPAVSQPQAVSNGRGNGRICGYTTGPWSGCESADYTTGNGSWPWAGGTGAGGTQFRFVFDHLAAANLWDLAQYDETSASSNAPGIGYPQLRIKSYGIGPSFDTTRTTKQGGMVVGWEPGLGYIPEGHKIRLGYCQNAVGNGSFICGLNPWEAQALDTKMDDGKPLSGRFILEQISGGYQYGSPSMTYHGYYAYFCQTGAGYASYIQNEAGLQSHSGAQVYRYCSVSIMAQF